MLKFHPLFPLSRIPNKNPAKFRRSNLSVPRLKPSFARLLAFSSSSRSKNERTEPEHTERRAKETSVALLRNETSEIYQLDNFRRLESIIGDRSRPWRSSQRVITRRLHARSSLIRGGRGRVQSTEFSEAAIHSSHLARIMDPSS